MHGGKRWRTRVDDLALVRGATESVTSKQTAERVWEPKFLGELIAGRDPHVNPNAPKMEQTVTVAEFLDRYYTNYVEAEGLKNADTFSGYAKALKAGLGDHPVTVLEMLHIQNRHVDWSQHQIAIPGEHAKDSENRRIPFDPQGRLAPILKRRATL